MRRPVLANAVALAAAMIFVFVQSAMLQVHAAPSAASAKDSRQVEAVRAVTHDHNHVQGSGVSDHAADHAALPDSEAGYQACDDLCCISGCIGALIADGQDTAVSTPVHAFLSTIQRHHFGRSTAPPDNPPRF